MDERQFSEALNRLTPKQREVLTRVLSGEPDSEIAASLDITLATVRKHVERIYRVLSIFGEPDDRRAKRGDLFALFAKYKPELLGVETTIVTEKVAAYLSASPASLRNPFVPLTGMVSDTKLFFNRHQEIRRIFEILNTGSSVVVIGERGIGKSSLLLAICREAESKLSKPRKPIYLNLQPLESEDDFYSALCDAVGIDENTRGFRLVRSLRESPLLLAIDEVENEPVFTANIRSQLRGLAEGIDAPVRLVIAAIKPLDEMATDEEMTSPLAGICIQQNLNPWNEDTTRAFVNARLESAPVTFTPDEITEIVKESKGHPQTLMQLCHQTYARYMEKEQ